MKTGRKRDMKRTQDEIVKRIEDRKSKDLMGFECCNYIDFLDFEHAEPYLEGTTKEDWEGEEGSRPLTDPVKAIKGYMEFAWDKANNFRGLSANRNLSHMVAWLWLDGQDEFLEENDNFRDYKFYGKDELVKICELYGIDHKKYDDGVRQNYEK